MMNSPDTDLTFMVPLSYEAHQIAERQFQQQQQSERAKQAYLNSLAVYAVDYYLNCLGWTTDRSSSDSANPLVQQFIDSADLLIPNLGRLECRPVLPGQTACEIPAEVWEERIGYVAVQFDQSLRQAEILGFVQSPASTIPLNQLQSLEDLLVYLDRLPKVQPTQPIRLMEWLNNLFTAGWQSLEALGTQLEPALVFRNEANRPTLAKGFKVINLGSTDSEVILVITQQLTEDEQIDVQIEVRPISEQSFLPIGLQIAILDEQGKSFLTAETRPDNPPVLLEMSGDRGDTFSIKMTLGECSVSEMFML